MRTPEPPDRDEREDSPPRLARPKRTTRPPNNYAREQEIDTDRRKTRFQQKERIELGDRCDEATSDDAATEREELDVGGLVRERSPNSGERSDSVTKYTRKKFREPENSSVPPSRRSDTSYSP